ncbi:DUF1801 domain-containing protein [Streptomyces sp. NBC_00827]|uniref:DUF1801 domain-containing protein n=1 Tax=Streptomyces sp. NBC_00827 TaxID=2903677 RepID=UPI00386A66FC|nr:DUF1801 domain-containing protein [Streptomyces sp. NBC_00827]
MTNTNAEVDQFMAALDHPQKETIGYLRAAVLSSDPGITEHVKWKAPSFLHGGEDRVTFQLRAKKGVQLIFHRGAKVKDDQAVFEFTDDSGLLDWISSDRATVIFQDLDDVKAKEEAFVVLVRNWVKT